ncbi:MAG: DUF6361 family protein [Verrucomicrobiota bacterium]|jgi:hypothetical protein
MTSSFTWLDYSEQERRKMIDVIHSFDEKGTRDELGISTIRDGLADLLFPGTGTVQTRARYFLFIPWIYKELEQRNTPAREIVAKARVREIELITALEKGGEKNTGVIGVEAREELQRLPSIIYWNGLGVWGARLFQGSQEQYHRNLDAWYQQKSDLPKVDPGESSEGTGLQPNWHPGMPAPHNGWRWELDFQLTRPEARFLRDGILNRTSGSLLAHLVTREKSLAEADFCWFSEAYGDFPLASRVQVDHARTFSEIIHGAALIYNLMLAQKASKKSLVESYRERLREWSKMLEDRAAHISQWDATAFWKMLSDQDVRVTRRTTDFVSEWIRHVKNTGQPWKLADDKEVRLLIQERERTLKRGLARLENPRALELWNEEAGTGRLDFRWRVSRQMINDILEGLGHA